MNTNGTPGPLPCPPPRPGPGCREGLREPRSAWGQPLSRGTQLRGAVQPRKGSDPGSVSLQALGGDPEHGEPETPAGPLLRPAPCPQGRRVSLFPGPTENTPGVHRSGTPPAGSPAAPGLATWGVSSASPRLRLEVAAGPTRQGGEGRGAGRAGVRAPLRVLGAGPRAPRPVVAPSPRAARGAVLFPWTPCRRLRPLRGAPPNQGPFPGTVTVTTRHGRERLGSEGAGSTRPAHGPERRLLLSVRPAGARGAPLGLGLCACAVTGGPPPPAPLPSQTPSTAGCAESPVLPNGP